MRCAILLAVCALVDGQPAPDAGQVAALTANAQKFVELYGFATQLMNLGGSIIGNAQDGSRGAGSSFGSSGNGILGEVVRPQLRGVSNYEIPSYKSPNSFSEYGGGPLGGGAGGVRSAQQTGLEALLNGFLGSSVSPSASSTPNIGNFFSPSAQPEPSYSSGSGSNIDGIINALMRSGAKPATPESAGTQNLLSQFFG